jgi:hypothetical protein
MTTTPVRPRKQISAVERLLGLPGVFRGADLTVRFQWTSKTASQYIYLWKNRGLIDGLGGHSDVFVNLLAARPPDWEKALLAAMPSAVAIGVDALRQAGWTTQIPARPEIAVNASRPVFTASRFEVLPRCPEWFGLASSGILRGDGLLPVLRPAWALADMLANGGGWGACGLHPDDIEWQEATNVDCEDWRAACLAFGLPATDLHAHAAPCQSK